MRRREEIGFSNPICWLLGHDASGKIVPGSFRLVSGEIVGAWQSYCKRCQDPENFPNDQYADRRNLYRRTIPPWIERMRNCWRFRNVKRDWDRGREAHIRYLDEQIKKYSIQKPKG